MLSRKQTRGALRVNHMGRGSKKGKASEAVMSRDVGEAEVSGSVWSSAVSHGVRGADYVESLTRGCVLPAFTQQDIAPMFKCGGECLDSLKLISGCSQKMRRRWQEGGRFRRLEAGGRRWDLDWSVEMKRRAQYSVPGCDRIGIVQKPRTRKGRGERELCRGRLGRWWWCSLRWGKLWDK